MSNYKGTEYTILHLPIDSVEERTQAENKLEAYARDNWETLTIQVVSEAKPRWDAYYLTLVVVLKRG